MYTKYIFYKYTSHITHIRARTRTHSHTHARAHATAHTHDTHTQPHTHTHISHTRKHPQPHTQNTHHTPTHTTRRHPHQGEQTPTCIIAGLLVPPPVASTTFGGGMPILSIRPLKDKKRPSTTALASAPGPNASSTISSAEYDKTQHAHHSIA